jgi:AcrR family transcriptional regulator
MGRRQIAHVQRARLLASVTAAVVRSGVAEVTVSEVLDGAGMSRRTFYELFDGIEDCLRAALEQALAAARDTILDAYDPTMPWRERVRAALAALLVFCEDEPLCAHLLLVDSLAAGPQVLERRMQILDRLARELDVARRESSSGRAAQASALLADGIVGGVASILHERVRAGERELSSLCGPLMAMIVLPYLGPAAARREHDRSPPPRPPRRRVISPPAGTGVGNVRSGATVLAGNPLQGLPMRLTYRTVCVLRAIAAQPGASNREIGLAADVLDQGQISKLLARLSRLGLVRNDTAGATGRGIANTWLLTDRGADLVRATGPDPEPEDADPR